MRLSSALFIGLVLVASQLCAVSGETSNVNMTLDENTTARTQAVAKAVLGLPGDGASLNHFPAGMNDVNETRILLNHTTAYSRAHYHNIAVTVPFDAMSTIGFGISRFGINDLALIPSLDPDSYNGEKFNVTDYVFTAALARKWWQFDIGGNIHLLYRRLDQDGMGIRGDMSFRYKWQDMLYFGGVFKGFIPSTARWQSEETEVEPPDLYLGAGIKFTNNYIYGSFRAALQSQGLFQKRAKSQVNPRGRRLHENPMDIAHTMGLALEYQLDMGLRFRLGAPELGELFSNGLPTMGMGYLFKKQILIDYAFSSHTDLPGSHRVTLTFIPKLKGLAVLRPAPPSSQSNKAEPLSDPSNVGSHSEEQSKSPSVPVAKDEAQKKPLEDDSYEEEPEVIEEVE